MRWLLLLAALAVACGDDAAPATDAPPDTPPALDILERLRALPGVAVTEEQPVNAPPGYRYFVLRVTQPVDHTSSSGPTFEQRVSLIHTAEAAPMIMHTSGYADFTRDFASEPTQLLRANQISIEHRFFGSSRPEPADWSKLTVKQMADDQHAIVVLLRGIYGAAWVSTGGSKGGMTATYHRRFYPDDVAGTVAYVAPLSFAIPDARYATNMEAIGTPACRDALHAVTTELLQNRRAAMVQRAQAQGNSYTRITLGAAVESAITDLEWTFWQYFGLGFCDSIPPVAATDDEMFDFLDGISGVDFYDDGTTAAFDAYFYQAYAQLGSPGFASVRGDALPPHLASLRAFVEADYAGALPLGVPIPAHDPSAMQDIDAWVQTEGKNLIFIYGEWDPWSGGAYRLGAATDSLVLVAPAGTHGAGIADIAGAERAAVFAKLAQWTGVTPGSAAPKQRARPRHHRRPAAGF